MEYKIVDARGQKCPKPLIMTKTALKEQSRILLYIDDDISRDNVFRFLQDNRIEYSVEKKEDYYSVSVNNTADKVKDNASEHTDYPKGKIVQTGGLICIKNNKMGFGDDELGGILIKAFCNTIKELEPLPSVIVFYNSGVHLTTDFSSVIESLRELENLGVEILICGTCAEYFNLKDKIHIGKISNMYSIMEALNKACSIIIP